MTDDQAAFLHTLDEATAAAKVAMLAGNWDAARESLLGVYFAMWHLQQSLPMDPDGMVRGLG